MRRLVSVLFLMFAPTCVMADDIQLLLPDNNVSSAPILEFRARRPLSKEEAERLGREPSRAGHAYVLLGRELDNGTLFYNQVRGFYADRDDKITLVQKMYTKGVVKQTLDDASSDVTFRVRITPAQETAIRKLFRDWDDKKYSLVLQNCVDFTKAVAVAAKLRVPPGPENMAAIVPEFPVSFISGLSELNDKDTPLRGGASPAATPGAQQPPRFLPTRPHGSRPEHARSN